MDLGKEAIWENQKRMDGTVGPKKTGIPPSNTIPMPEDQNPEPHEVRLSEQEKNLNRGFLVDWKADT